MYAGGSLMHLKHLHVGRLGASKAAARTDKLEEDNNAEAQIGGAMRTDRLKCYTWSKQMRVYSQNANPQERGDMN